MKKLTLTCACAVLLGAALTGCLPKKEAKSDAELQEMIEKAAEKKVAEMEKQREMQEKIDRADAIIAADEARKAEAKKKPVQTQTTHTVVVDVPGTRYAHVIREGGYTNARSGPGTGYAILNKVKDGSPILYSGRLVRNGWVQVYDTRGNYLGYMSANKIVP